MKKGNFKFLFLSRPTGSLQTGYQIKPQGMISDRIIVITIYSPSCHDQETAEKPFDVRVKLPPAQCLPVYNTWWAGGGFTPSLLLLNIKTGKL